MKKKILSCILISALIFQFCGCGEADQDKVNDNGVAEADNSGTSGESGSSGEDLFLSLTDLPWRDNSLDAYSAVLNMPLRYTEQKNALGGGARMYILGSTRASVFKKHLFEKAEECWDEIKSVTAQDAETSFRLAFREGELNQAWAVGGIAGSDHYMMMTTEWDEDQGLSYRFFETDENMQVLNSFYVDCLDKNDYENPISHQFKVDAQGNLHMITSRYSDSTYHYYIVAPDGILLLEVNPREGFQEEQIPDLFFLYDGRVGMRLGEQLQCVDVETGQTEVLANIKGDYRCCILWDEKTLLYADSKGLYRSGLSGENPELLYTWSNHGVFVLEIEAIQVTESGYINLIYMDGGGANYLRLTPTTEEVEIQEITFGVYGNGSKYQAAVAAFNKKHPAYRIRINTYELYDTRLLTELAAGKGPVLVDTLLTGFENNAEWWEPLDEVFRQMKLDEELIPKVLDAGRINGTLYGVVTDFSLNTVVTFAEKPVEWDYDTFLGCFDEDDASIKSVYNVFGRDGYSFIATFFYHDLQEKYLFDAENCTTYFESDKFRKILRLGRYFMEEEHQGGIEGLWHGEALCATVGIYNPADMACLRIWGGNKLRFIGYPSGEGSKHYIQCGNPITVRVNATAEEKQLAHSFIRFLLSYEAQMEVISTAMYSNMSVRKDILEEQIKGMDEYTYTITYGFPQFSLGDQVDNELDGATLYELLEKAEPKQYMPRELVSIFSEELDLYLSGSQTEDMLIEHLGNRVGLYLSEQKQ